MHLFMYIQKSHTTETCFKHLRILTFTNIKGSWFALAQQQKANVSLTVNGPLPLGSDLVLFNVCDDIFF